MENSCPKNRIVHFGEEELRVLAKTFENSDDWEATKLVGIHNKEIIVGNCIPIALFILNANTISVPIVCKASVHCVGMENIAERSEAR